MNLNELHEKYMINSHESSDGWLQDMD